MNATTLLLVLAPICFVLAPLPLRTGGVNWSGVGASAWAEGRTGPRATAGASCTVALVTSAVIILVDA